MVPLSQLDSPFQLQEHLKSLYSEVTHTPNKQSTIPVTKETAQVLATPPQISPTEQVDKNLWLYELCRFLTQRANIVSIFLMNDSPPCSAQTCPEMRASEWQYLCAVHEPPKSCCAIDYCNHTLDWAANVLTSPKHFPSRLNLGGNGANNPSGETGNAMQSMRQLTNIFRRVYRIFAHAWFQHREVFWSVEGRYGLYVFFKAVCDAYRLIPEDSYTIPPEAEGAPAEQLNSRDPARPQILKKSDPNTQQNIFDQGSTDAGEESVPTTQTTGATTRRHKHTPSTGSHVATIPESAEQEDEEDAPPQPSSTVATKSPALPQIAKMAGSEGGTSESTETSAEAAAASEDKPLPSPSTGKGLKLNITSPLPKFDAAKLGAEDPEPTPTGNEADIDPISVHKVASSTESTSGTLTEPPTSTSSNTESKQEAAPETPINQITTSPFPSLSTTTPLKQENDDDGEEEVTSPSGGSIRTAGNDLLKAILGHMHDENDDDHVAPIADKDLQMPGAVSTGSPGVGVSKIKVEEIQDEEEDKAEAKNAEEEGREKVQKKEGDMVGEDGAEGESDDENEAMSPVQTSSSPIRSRQDEDLASSGPPRKASPKKEQPTAAAIEAENEEHEESSAAGVTETTTVGSDDHNPEGGATDDDGEIEKKA
jgi:hypothetical protein